VAFEYFVSVILSKKGSWMDEILDFLKVDKNTFDSLKDLNDLQNFDSIKKMELLLLLEKKSGRLLDHDEMSKISNIEFLESFLS
jgi:acyl carrier protein